MKYLKNDLFIAITGKPFVVKETDDESGEVTFDGEASIGKMLEVTLKTYELSHATFVRQGNVLPPTEIVSYNRVMDILKEEPQENGYYRFESEPDFKVLKKVIGWVVPVSPWWRNGPGIQEVLDQAVSELPTDGKSDNGVVDPELLEKVES